MSLYFEAARFLDPVNHEWEDPGGGSLASRIHHTKDLRNKPTHIYALIRKATKWSAVLTPVINKTEILGKHTRLTPALALLLVHDLLLSKNGIAAPLNHALRNRVEMHKVFLRSELTRARVKAGYESLEAWEESFGLDEDAKYDDEQEKFTRPRWVRINVLKTTLEQECESGVFQGWQRLSSTAELIQPSKSTKALGKAFAVDDHVQHLVAIPFRSSNYLTNTVAYKKGRIILQDKASCFPAALMDPLSTSLREGDIIDACAAPGNKSTHLAALLAFQTPRDSNTSSVEAVAHSRKRTVFSTERGLERSEELGKMVKRTGAHEIVEVVAKQDFFRLSPYDQRLANVTGILLDPSCTGSGLVDPDHGEQALEGFGCQLVLPTYRDDPVPEKKPSSAFVPRFNRGFRAKAKLGHFAVRDIVRMPLQQEPEERLVGLQGFQATLLKHAMSFPQCSRIVYSTCSIHIGENEEVVVQALSSGCGFQFGIWKPLPREKQVEGMRQWPRRGNLEACRRLTAGASCNVPHINAQELAQACIRCERGTEDGTIGFFACALERELIEGSQGESEWEGFDSTDSLSHSSTPTSVPD